MEQIAGATQPGAEKERGEHRGGRDTCRLSFKPKQQKFWPQIADCPLKHYL